MKRKECEKLILEKLKEIYEIYHEYNPEGEYLHMSIMSSYIDGIMFSCNNSYYDKDAHSPIDFDKIEGENDETI